MGQEELATGPQETVENHPLCVLQPPRPVMHVHLAPARFEGAAKVFNDFMSRGKGGGVGLCPYSWCPMSTDDFSKLYREYPDTLSTTAVAVREADDAVVGTIRLSVYGQPRSSGDEEIHKLKPGEVCAVSLRAWALTS